MKEQQKGVSFGTINLDYVLYIVLFILHLSVCIFYLKSEMRNKLEEIGEMVWIKRAQDIFFTNSDEIDQTYAFAWRSIHKTKFW